MIEDLEKKYSIKYVIRDVALISYPKSGRTWLRMIMAKIIEQLGYDTDKYEAFPAFHHTPEKLIKELGNQIKIIILKRDEADATLSYFSEKSSSSRSGAPYSGTISDFVRDPSFGIRTAISYNWTWIQDRSFKCAYLTTYEALKQEALLEVRNICNFVGLECTDDIILKAINYSSFDNMKKIDNGEGENLLRRYKGNFGSTPGRVRKGLVKGYLSELSAEDIEYVEEEKRKVYGTN